MLEAYIIQEIKRREAEKLRQEERPRLEIPIALPNMPPKKEEPSRVITIETKYEQASNFVLR